MAVFPCIFVGLGLNKLLDVSKFIRPKVYILQCFGINELLGQIPAVGRGIGTKSLSLSVFSVADVNKKIMSFFGPIRTLFYPP